MNEIEKTRPWYAEPMVWLAAGIPATSVVVGIAFMTTAIVTWDGLVVGDYYKQGKEINLLLARDQQARSLGLSAVLSADELNSRLYLRVSTLRTSNSIADESLQLRFVHRTRSEFDEKHDLHRQADGLYAANGSLPTNGLWTVLVETPEWRLVRKGLNPVGQETNLSAFSME